MGFFEIKVAPGKTKTPEQKSKDLENSILNQEMVKNFNVTKKVSTFIEFDENQKKWLIPDRFFGNKKNPKVYDYIEILDCELLEDEDSVTKGGLGMAAVGGALFGGVGAIVGSVAGGKKTKSIVNSMKIKITLNNMSTPTTYINLFTTPTKTDSFIYKSMEALAQEIMATIAVILSENSGAQTSNAKEGGSSDEIRIYKQLLDDEIITQEEFNAKKKQLLGL